MRNSTNYSLLLPDEDDYYVVGDFNSNTEIIDAQMKSNENVIQTHAANKSNPHGVTKEQVGLGNVPNVATNDQTPTYSDTTTLATLVSGEKLNIALQKIKFAISSLISHVADNVTHITSAERTAWNAKLDKSGGTTTGKLTTMGGLDVTFAEQEANALRIARFGVSEEHDEYVTMTLNDANFMVKYTNDEVSNNIVFVLENTDAEVNNGNAGTGALANSSTVTFSGDANGSKVTANSFVGSVVGNASSASKLAAPRTISLTGDVSGSVSFDGSGNVSMTTTVADDSHNHIIANVDGLQDALNRKADAFETVSIYDMAQGRLQFSWDDYLKGLIVLIDGNQEGVIYFGGGVG